MDEKEKIGLVRIGEEALELVKFKAYNQKITNKEYVEKLIYKDTENLQNIKTLNGILRKFECYCLYTHEANL